MRVLITGDRNWTNREAIRRELEKLVRKLGEDELLIVVHGAARGADTIAGEVARALGADVEEHPADWERYRPKDPRKKNPAGPIRNREMLDPRPSLVLAFHEDISQSKGTADMVRQARRAGIPVEVFDA